MLEPGLSMYLPTGTPHSARSEDATSLHVTVGINQVTARDALRELTERLLADPRHDLPLPAVDTADPARAAAVLGSALSEALATYVEQLRGHDVEAQARDRVDRFLTARTPALAGGLADLVALDELDDDTWVSRRPTAACALREDGERLRVLLGDRSLSMPLRLRPVMEHVRDTGSFRVGDLAPWLDRGSRAVVARRLVREGLLTLHPRR